eukprot:TRINITY_DN4000_c0_g1_i1.p1 TRINITY_DN4000_c0_g1~~TRINITY_DN4000_c0_g1_i1.p1  ORF type:complete len:292 (+),score=101.54 TRINITY_DN4000_c0_g1_i1:61-936(+)
MTMSTMSTTVAAPMTAPPPAAKRGSGAPTLVRKIGRSPHLLEVFLCYGSWTLIMACTSLKYYGISFLELACYTALGTALYTFIEYWFHRVILHEWLSGPHGNHHKRPRNLRIIATPLIPVQVYGLMTMILFMYLFGREVSYGINCGIAIGQMTMDTVHVLFHSNWRPWYLESARSYHLFHHFTDEEFAHGLTTSFWDMVFGTLPANWYYYKKYPVLRYIQLPFPLLNFIILGFLAGDETKTHAAAKADEEKLKDHAAEYRPHGEVSPNYILVSWITVLSSWFLIDYVLASQ